MLTAHLFAYGSAEGEIKISDCEKFKIHIDTVSE